MLLGGRLGHFGLNSFVNDVQSLLKRLVLLILLLNVVEMLLLLLLLR